MRSAIARTRSAIAHGTSDVAELARITTAEDNPHEAAEDNPHEEAFDAENPQDDEDSAAPQTTRSRPAIVALVVVAALVATSRLYEAVDAPSPPPPSLPSPPFSPPAPASPPQLLLSSLEPLQLLPGPLPGFDAEGVCHKFEASPPSTPGPGDGTQSVSRRLSSAKNSWRDSIATARALVGNMTRAEKVAYVHGEGWVGYQLTEGFYVGSVPALPRLRIPSINIQDGPAGFRTTDTRIVGTVTAWPSQLALGATWDPDLAYSYAEALGREFRAHGANVALGPGLNIARVARCGRLSEYLTGEEPGLGAALGTAYVRGLQSVGVAAVAKHFVANTQENSRLSVDARISQRALNEVYLPAWRMVVRAGIASIMCGYNLVNGVHACGPSSALHELKESLGFQGWVMSDWWAITSSAALPLVDQEMPGTPVQARQAWYSDAVLAQADTVPAVRSTTSSIGGSALDGMVSRILGGMLRADAFREPLCSVGCNCDAALYTARPPPAEHTALSRRVAAASIVLLKNEPPRRSASAAAGVPVLPLVSSAHTKTRIALVGSACSVARHIAVGGDWKTGSYYVVGGSGRVIAPDAEIVTVRKALAEIAGIDVVVSATDGVAAALHAARDASVIIACAGATASESVDRPHLGLDQDWFLRDFAFRLRGERQNQSLVVLVNAPGPFLTAGWSEHADALAVMFLGGAQAGHAWADVLTGAVNPSGRLPVTLPLEETDVTAPCTTSQCIHTEDLRVGWRALVNQSVAYGFGHGLSFSTFHYEFADTPLAAASATLPLVVDSKTIDDDEDAVLQLRVRIRNDGGLAGREVVQLYLAFPKGAGEPPLVMRGFQPTATLAPGESTTIEMALLRRDLSVWNEGSTDDPDQRKGWRTALGSYQVHVGASSRDLRLSSTFHLAAAGM